MKLTLEIDDDDVRRLLEPLIQGQRTALASPPNSKLMTVKQVAAELGISMSRAYELINKGEIRSLAIGRTRRVPAVALAEFIARPAPRPIELATEPRRASPKAVEIDPTPKPSEVLLARRPRKKEPAPNPLDLSPRPLVPGSHRHQMTDEQWENLYRWLSEKGWPDDVVDRVRADRTQGIERVTC